MRHVTPLLWLALAACGDELADADYRGEPLFVIQGPVAFPDGLDFLQVASCEEQTHDCFISEEESCADEGCFEPCDEIWESCIAELDGGPEVDSLEGVSLRLGLFWSRAGVGGGAGDEGDRVEQTAHIEPGFPARYELALHAPPPDAVVKSTRAGRYAIGLVLVYIDADFDERFTPGRDQIAGGAPERAILYTPAGVELGDTSWRAGYHRVLTGQVCDEAADGGKIIDLAADDAPTLRVELSATPGFLAALLLDEDCDCQYEWPDVCPPEEQLEAFCDDGEVEPGVCDLCFEQLFCEEEPFD